MKNFIVVLGCAGLFALVGCTTTETTTTTTETRKRPSATMDPSIDNTRSTVNDVRGPR